MFATRVGNLPLRGKNTISMKKSMTALAVCIGGPLLLLGFGAPIASAAPGDHGATVSIDGTLRHQGPGVAESGATGDGNKAIAVNGSTATANEFPQEGNNATGSTVIAVNNSYATTGSDFGPVPTADNRAIAINGSTAAATDGNNNTSTAINGSRAFAGPGHDNTATAINDSVAFADAGSSITARAVCGGYAILGNTASVNGHSCGK
jgi:hypothetical protein